MITVVVETQRVYSHGDDGMPKVEIIQQKLEKGANFNKFLKYLPFQRYLTDKLKIVEAVQRKDGELIEVDKAPFEKQLNEVVAKLNVKEETIHDKYAKEKQRNDELMERIASLEAKFNNEQKEDLKEVNPFEDATKEELTKAYKVKFGKQPYNGWKKDVLIKRLKD